VSRVGLLEERVFDALVGGAAPRIREHVRRQVHAQRRPVRRRSRREQGGLTGAASDVEQAIVVADCRRGEQPPVVGNRGRVEVVGVRGTAAPERGWHHAQPN
jgi:hypothetical protein